MPYLRRRKGLGDWFTPTCDASDPSGNCVPHWYCYVPFMATPDCLQSFGQGVKQIVSAPASAVGTAIGSSVSGATSGLVQGIVDSTVGSNDGSSPGFSIPWGTVALVAVVAVLAIGAVGGGSPRRYGR